MAELILPFYQDWFPPIVFVGIGIAHRSKSCLRGQGVKAFHSLVINIWRCLSIDLRCNKDNLKSSSSFITLVWRRKVNCQAGVDTCLKLVEWLLFRNEIGKGLRAVYFCSKSGIDEFDSLWLGLVEGQIEPGAACPRLSEQYLGYPAKASQGSLFFSSFFLLRPEYLKNIFLTVPLLVVYQTFHVAEGVESSSIISLSKDNLPGKNNMAPLTGLALNPKILCSFKWYWAHDVLKPCYYLSIAIHAVASTRGVIPQNFRSWWAPTYLVHMA